MRKLSSYLPAYIVTIERPEWKVPYNSLRSLTLNDPLHQLETIRERLWNKKAGSRIHLACIDLFGVQIRDEEMYWQISLRFLAFNVSEFQAYAAVGEEAIAIYGGAPWIKSELVSTTHKARSFYTRRPILRRYEELQGIPGFWIDSKLYGDALKGWKKWNSKFEEDLFLQFHGKYRLVQVDN